MTPIQWLEIVALGIIFGGLGQGARTIVGIKKLNDYADDANPLSALIDGMRLLTSFGIGGVAGAFAAVTLITDFTKPIPLEQLFAIAAAGYTGSDFIEGFIGRISGSPGKVAPKSTAASTTDSSDDAVG
jgi:putative chitinase